MIDKDTLVATRAAVAALDLTAENTRIAELQAEIDRCEKAKETAQGRCNEIGAILRDQAYGHPRHVGAFEDERAGAIADALLAEASPTEAAEAGPSVAELERERDALVAGQRDLQRRINEALREIEAVKGSAKQKVGDAAAPLVAPLMAEAREAARKLVDAYAGLSGLAAFGGPASTAARSIETAVVGAYSDRLITGASWPVPDEISDVVAGLAGKTLPFRLYRRATVNLNDVHTAEAQRSALMVRGAVEAARAQAA